MSAVATPLPRAPFAAVLTVLGAALVLSAAARFSGYAQAPQGPAAIASTELTFSDAANGAVDVRNALTGQLVSTVPAQKGGFLRSTMRVLMTLRIRDGYGPTAPFTLTEMPGGTLRLTDTVTGQALELEAFGPSNEGEFAKIFYAAEAQK